MRSNESVGDAPVPLILGADSPGTLIGTQSPLHRHQNSVGQFFSRFICATSARVIIKLVLRERAFRTDVSRVRRSVGAPTTNARQGNGSHHP
jgi:hypothetical protein